MPDDCVQCWDSFRSRYNNITYCEKLTPGYSNCLTAACVELATVYTNAIVERFESKIKSYFTYRILKLFEKANIYSKLYITQ